ncbi:hypothetical protein [Acaryochloris marina]|uniref:hypothetical protein n=1 Tax=Acaryochloris marina TaxID=155978 RepID=UPI001BB0325B|nr:hypothetical protein [Acaryochloris marina]QUY45580.1 hypothetical protein I1H34_27920 [Acaryochloris marina S15]
MRNPNHYRFRMDTVWDKDQEITTIIETAKAHYRRSFSEKCVTILYAVFKPLAVALQTNSVAEVRKAIELSRDKVETFYDLALILVSSEETTPDEPSLPSPPAPSMPTVELEIVQPPSDPYEPPREAEESPVVDSGSSAPSIYAGFEEDD